jgi:hypothetical protein
LIPREELVASPEGETMLPLRREKGILIQELAGETVVYDQQRHKVHCLNQTAGLVWRHCDGQTSIAELAKLVSDEANLPASEELVQYCLDHLAQLRLLQDHQQFSKHGFRLSRRDFARKLGVAAVLVPAIMTITAPTAAAAASLAINTPCTSNSQCSSGCCCQNNSGMLKGTCQTTTTCGGNNNCANM